MQEDEEENRQGGRVVIPVQEGVEEENRQGGRVAAIEGRASAVDAPPSPAKNLCPSPQGEFGVVQCNVE